MLPERFNVGQKQATPQIGLKDRRRTALLPLDITAWRQTGFGDVVDNHQPSFRFFRGTLPFPLKCHGLFSKPRPSAHAQVNQGNTP